MGAVFAGASRAPITAVVIMFELTGEYSIILPLMTAIVLATGDQPPAQPRHRLLPQAAPSRHRPRRPRDHRPSPRPGRQVMQPVHRRCPRDLTLAHAADRLARSPTACSRWPTRRRLPGRAHRTGRGRDHGRGARPRPGAALVEATAPLRETQDVHDGLGALEHSGFGAVPVLGTEGDESWAGSTTATP